jgi:formylmethanofuran dehydrogenase subunit D
VPIAAHFIPPDKLDHGARELKQYMPTVRAALEGLDEADDVTLVDVTQPGEHVVVKKEGGSVIVNVVDSDETVYVSTPIRAIESTVEQIASASEHSKNTDSADFQ